MMDKFHNLLARSFLGEFFSGKMTGEENVNFSWRILLGIVTLCGAGIIFFTLMTYQWSTEVPNQTTTGKNRVSFSRNELHDVILFYEQRTNDHKSLLQSRPEEPHLERGSTLGVSNASSTGGM